MVYFSKNKVSHKWRRLKLLFRRLDFAQIFPMLGLISIGILFIYSTGQQTGDPSALHFWEKQLGWTILGLSVWTVLTFSNYKSLRYWAIPVYIACIALLLCVLFFGLKIYGSKRWLQIFSIRLQPSEFAKFGVLLITSWLLSLKFFNVNKFTSLALIAVITGIPFFLIFKQPDLGSSLVLIPMVAVILFVANLNWKLIAVFALLGIAVVPAAYPFLSNYQKERILVFLDPERDPRNRGWNQLQSELAVGSGGMTGKGFMQGTQNTLGFIPKTVSNTDFIFSVIAEETGFIGSASIVILYAMLIFSALRTAIMARDDFGRYMAAGIAAIFFTHSVINIGMSIRIMPVTGIPLPLISYGGSFMLTSLIYLGVLQSIYAHRRTAFFSDHD